MMVYFVFSHKIALSCSSGDLVSLFYVLSEQDLSRGKVPPYLVDKSRFFKWYYTTLEDAAGIVVSELSLFPQFFARHSPPVLLPDLDLVSTRCDLTFQILINFRAGHGLKAVWTYLHISPTLH